MEKINGLHFGWKETPKQAWFIQSDMQLGKKHFRVYSRFSHYPRLFGGSVEKTCGTEVDFNMVAIRNRTDLYKSTGRLLGVAQGRVIRTTLPSLSVLCNNKEHGKYPPYQQLL